MARFRSALWAVAFLASLATIPPPAFAEGSESAARLSNALGGSLEDGMIAAANGGYGAFTAQVPLLPGRGEKFRKYVAATALSAERVGMARSHFATSAR